MIYREGKNCKLHRSLFPLPLPPPGRATVHGSLHPSRSFFTHHYFFLFFSTIALILFRFYAIGTESTRRNEDCGVPKLSSQNFLTTSTLTDLNLSLYALYCFFSDLQNFCRHILEHYNAVESVNTHRDKQMILETIKG